MDDDRFELKKSLGQNWLKDPNINRKIAAAAEVKAGDKVLEIGPGSGLLTEALLGAGAHVLAVEIDRRLIPILEEIFTGNPNLQILHNDFLKLPEDVIAEFSKGEKIKVVANLPYYNASQILFRLTELKKYFTLAVLTLQKEFVDRVEAKPNSKDYGALTLKIGAVARAEGLFIVPAHVFFPKPKVDSRVLFVDFETSRLPGDIAWRDFNRCVSAAFSARRKTIANALSRQYDKGQVAAALSQCEIDPRKRAENLELGDYFKLTRALG